MSNLQRVIFLMVLILWLCSAAPGLTQTIPACSGATNEGASYETCTNGLCEKFVCNGTSFMAQETWSNSGTRNIDFGNDPSVCTAERTGRLRYAGGNIWEYCNGSVWTGFSGSLTLPINGNNAVLPQGRIIGIGTPLQRNLLSYAGTRNIFLGDDAGGAITTGTDNTFIGYSAGNANVLGSSNIFVGSGTGGLTVLASNNIIVGINIDTPTALTSNYINIGNVLWGNMTTNGSNTGTADNSASLAIDGSLNWAPAPKAAAAAMAVVCVIMHRLKRCSIATKQPGRIYDDFIRVYDTANDQCLCDVCLRDIPVELKDSQFRFLSSHHIAQ